MKIIEQTKTKIVLRRFPWGSIWFLICWLLIATFALFLGFYENDIVLILCVIISCLVFIFYISFTSKVETCTFDKSFNSMILKRQTLFKTKLIQYSIEAISGVKLEVIDTDTLGSNCYRITILLSSGKYIPLTLFYTSDLKNQEKIADYIAIFLNVPTYDVGGR